MSRWTMNHPPRTTPDRDDPKYIATQANREATIDAKYLAGLGPNSLADIATRRGMRDAEQLLNTTIRRTTHPVALGYLYRAFFHLTKRHYVGD
jgi:hypothetical protein